MWLYAFQIQKKELETNLRRQYVKWLKAQIAERECTDGFKHWLRDLKQDSKLPYFLTYEMGTINSTQSCCED